MQDIASQARPGRDSPGGDARGWARNLVSMAYIRSSDSELAPIPEQQLQTIMIPEMYPPVCHCSFCSSTPAQSNPCPGVCSVMQQCCQTVRLDGAGNLWSISIRYTLHTCLPSARTDSKTTPQPDQPVDCSSSCAPGLPEAVLIQVCAHVMQQCCQPGQTGL